MQPQQPTREEFVKTLFKLEPKDNIYSEEEARTKLMAGIRKGVDAIKVSYGASGSNAVIQEDLPPFHRITNDGRAILDKIKLADPVENIGLNFEKEVAAKSDRESGDGRKTSVLLMGAILEEGMKVDATPMEIKRSLDECLPLIIESIDKQKKLITPLDVGKVATIASEDEKLGALFQEIYEKIGQEGILELDNSGLPETFYEITEGVRLLNCGFLWPYMANEDKGRKAVYKNPKVLITKQKITSIADIDPIFKKLHESGVNELVIFCEDIELAVSQKIAQAHMEGMFKTLIIKAPVLWKDWLYEDFAKITGATVIDPATGTNLKRFQMSYLGSCEKIVTSKEETVVLGTKDIREHIKALEEEKTDDALLRASRLHTRTAILKLGANSETELSYLTGKATDARNASYLALRDGVVAGGGVALAAAAWELPATLGGSILKLALAAPQNQIVKNAGMSHVLIPSDGKSGFNAKTGKVEDMYAAGILDASLVVKNAIKNALSVVSNILTTRVVITTSEIK